MNAYQRIKRLVEGKTINPPAVSLWNHFPVVDRVPKDMIGKTIEFQETFGWDFVKICYNGLYSVEDWGVNIKWPTHPMEREKVLEVSIKKESDWKALKPLSPHEGALGRELKTTQKIVERFKGEVPVLATIFSPLTTGIKMCGEEIFQQMKNNSPDLITGLEIITKTTRGFVQSLAAIGVDGIFFASQLGTHDRMSVKDYRKYGEEFDRPILEALADKTWFNILHLHGQKPMLEELESYPVQAVNWHDRSTDMKIGRAAGITHKILIGGIDEHHVLKNAGKDSLKKHVEEALEEAGDHGLILGPGCVVPLDVEDRQFHLLKEIVSSLS